MTTDTPPRRKWNITRWLLVFALVAMAWSGWRVYAFRSALSEAKALGWEVQYRNPVDRIRQNWRAAFRKRTWMDGVTYLRIPKSEEFGQHLGVLHRLNPSALVISNAATLNELSALSDLTRLQELSLENCAVLTDLDALKSLSTLRRVWLSGSPRLTEERVAALRAALPTAKIIGP